MDDSNILYYIVLAVIYIISRVLKKKKQDQTTAESSTDDTGSGSQQTAQSQPTFEDLFKQITGESFGTPKTTEPVTPVGYSDDIETEYDPTPEPVLEDYVYKEEREKPREKIADIIDKNRRAENYEIREDEGDEGDAIREMLQDEDGLRRAVIVSEVFGRKY
ncbi:hypothetical protein [Reichenbachiella agariperforans]|uniref:hypothetical protein n=1 Tax=Reichenbachiella agariperforans TaxID=156994 RepID=UPI001C08DE32|nr:hypothetical protein [Reichenbachiella agariperforans]MBU2913748.1 hypothetical protein [Reichenbachiella agariperforans]